MDPRNKISDQVLDTAACDALGANNAAESAAYSQALVSSDEDARRIDRELRETVARLSATSPHLAPPPSLRGRILQATAPATFKMEDYKKVTQEPSRFYRWGFYAAMFFLMAASYYNMTYQSALKNAGQQIAGMKQQYQQHEVALANTLMHSELVTWNDQNGKPLIRAFVNQDALTAVLLMPQQWVPQGKTAQLSFPNKGGQITPYTTTLITVPADRFSPGMMPPNQLVDTKLAIEDKDLMPDANVRAREIKAAQMK